jgi:two-component system, cell cycle sensor histidine kinase and response regulator CckA
MGIKKQTIATDAFPVSSGTIPPAETFYKQLFELHQDVLFLLDATTGIIIGINESALNYFKKTKSEILGKEISNLNGLSQELIKTSTEEARRHGRDSFIQPHRFPGGAIRYLEYHSIPVHSEAGDILYYHVRDVTNREQEKYLLQYRIEFESVLSSISTYFVRPDHTQLHFAIRSALRTVAEFLVADRCYILLFTEDLSKISMLHAWNDEGVQPLLTFENISVEASPFAASVLLKGEVLKANDVNALADELHPLMSYKLKDKSRSVIMVPMISAGMVIGAIGVDSVYQERIWTEDAEKFLQMIGEIITNALHRKRMEEALRESENKYRQFFEEDLTGDYIAAADGKIRFCNPAFAKIFGFSDVDDVLSSQTRIHELLNESAAIYQNRLQESKTREENEFTFSRRNGEAAAAIGNLKGLFADGGQLLESRGYLYDITERKKLEEQLRGAQRIEAVGRLAGGIAHDFNNILTVINGYCELLLQQQIQSPAVREKIEQMKGAGDRGASLVSHLLAFSRKQIVQPRVVNLNTVVKGLEPMLRRLIGEHISFDIRMDPQLGNIKIDPAQLEQVIMNLVVNSRDAMPGGGNLCIETQNALVDEAFTRQHDPQKPGSYVLLLVKDSGIGMDEQIQAHIFEPFFTTKEKGKGTGLGLSTLYGIVKQGNGYVWVESAPEKGTTFSIYFPMYDQSVEEKETVQTFGENLQGQEHILIVEDDSPVRELTRSFLQHYGYVVYTAESGERALHICRSLNDRIDLAVIDVIMPGMSCKELSTEITRSFPRIKILFISGYTDETITQQGVLEPHVAFLQKPFSIEALGRKVRQVLDLS